MWQGPGSLHYLEKEKGIQPRVLSASSQRTWRCLLGPGVDVRDTRWHSPPLTPRCAMGMSYNPKKMKFNALCR
jgi:hypothetical protein